MLPSKKDRKAAAKAGKEASSPCHNTSSVGRHGRHSTTPQSIIIQGSDDMGNFYASHAELLEIQSKNRKAYYEANEKWWSDGGYGGKTDDEAMIGDEGGERDGDQGLAFLDRLLETLGSSSNTGSNNKNQKADVSRAMDAGAGVGRITKQVLLKRFDTVHLVEASSFWSKQSRVYLGKKRSSRCTFTCARLEQLRAQDISDGMDLIWLQWTLQYLTDLDAICILKTLAAGLALQQKNRGGVLVVKENRPFGTARSDRFQMDTPMGPNGRYDITRSDAHHRWLFQQASLQIGMTEMGEETNTYALTPDQTKHS